MVQKRKPTSLLKTRQPDQTRWEVAVQWARSRFRKNISAETTDAIHLPVLPLDHQRQGLLQDTGSINIGLTNLEHDLDSTLLVTTPENEVYQLDSTHHLQQTLLGTYYDNVIHLVTKPREYHLCSWPRHIYHEENHPLSNLFLLFRAFVRLNF